MLKPTIGVSEHADLIPPTHTPAALPVEAMLLTVTTPGENEHGLPPVTRTLPHAELLHRALIAIATRQGGHSLVLSGCDETGSPLRGPHDHVHIVPLDLDGDHHLEHILIWAPMGLDAAAQAAVRGVRRTFTKGGVGPLKLALVAAGTLSDLRRLPGTYGEHLKAILGPEAGASEWVSITPFVPPRYLKARGRNALAGQVAAELASRHLPDLAEVATLPLSADPSRLQLRHFVRQRQHGPSAPVDCGLCLRFRIAAPVKGPLALGYASHFGLGLFAAAQGSSG